MRKLTEIELKYYIYIQSKALKAINSDSINYMLGIIWFFTSLFMFAGINGNFNLILWILALYTIYRLFKTAMNAAEVGL